MSPVFQKKIFKVEYWFPLIYYYFLTLIFGDVFFYYYWFLEMYFLLFTFYLYYVQEEKNWSEIMLLGLNIMSYCRISLYIIEGGTNSLKDGEVAHELFSLDIFFFFFWHQISFWLKALLLWWSCFCAQSFSCILLLLKSY